MAADIAATAPPGDRLGRARKAARDGGSMLLLLFAAFLIPDVISLNLGSLRLPAVRLAVIALFIPAVLMFLRRRAGRLHVYDWFYILFCAWTILCIFINRGMGGVQPAGVFFLEYFVIYFMMAAMITTTAQLRAAVDIMIAVVIGLGVLATVEAVSGRHFLMDLAYRLSGKGSYGGAFFGDVEQAYRLGLLRATSIFSHPILYGLFCVTFLSFAWYTSRSMGTRLMRSGAVLVAAFMSLSAGPLVAMMAQIGLIGIEQATRGIKGRFAVLFGGFVAFIVAAQVLLESGVYRLAQLVAFSGGSTSYRALIWEHAVDDILRNPIFGMRQEEWTREWWMTPSLDNHWAVAMLIGGIPSVVFLAIALLLAVRANFARPDAEIPRDLAAMRRAWAFALAGMILAGGTVYFFDKLQPLLAIIMGFGGAIHRLILDAQDAGAAPTAAAPPPRRRAVLGDLAAARRQAPARPVRPAPLPGRRTVL